MGWPLRASIECTDRMLVFMGLVSLVATVNRCLALPPLLHWLAWGEKLGMDPQIGQPACYGLCQEPFFSGAVALLDSVDDYVKGCYMWSTWDTYGPRPYVDWAWEECGVLVGFFPAGCTSIRIAATLRYDLLAWFMTYYEMVMLYYNYLFALLLD
jgi:hypothetical protein